LHDNDADLSWERTFLFHILKPFSCPIAGASNWKPPVEICIRSIYSDMKVTYIWNVEKNVQKDNWFVYFRLCSAFQYWVSFLTSRILKEWMVIKVAHKSLIIVIISLDLYQMKHLFSKSSSGPRTSKNLSGVSEIKHSGTKYFPSYTSWFSDYWRMFYWQYPVFVPRGTVTF
jgi:hypothetical protein